MPQQYLSTDPNAGRPASPSGYLSTDPNAGTPPKPVTPARAEDFMPEPPGSFSLGDTVAGWWKNVNPAPLIKSFAETTADEWSKATDAAGRGDYTGAVLHAINAHPVTGVGRVAIDAGKAQWHQLVKAREAFQQGRLSEGVGYSMAGLLPLLGPMSAQAGESIGSGEIDRGIGEMAGIFTPKAVQAVLPARVPGMAPRLSPPEASAVALAERRGVPLDAATATGRPFVAVTQKRVADSMGGAGAAERMKASQTTSLTRVGDELAAQVSPNPADAVNAGQHVRDAVTSRIQQLHTEASTAYDTLRQLEQKQAGIVRQYGGVQAPPTSPKPFTTVPLAVDLVPSKAALRPLHQMLTKEKELVGVLQGGKARALVALDSIVNGPDMAPLSVVDAALGDLKAMARGAEMPELRTGGQAAAAQAVAQLDTQVRATAANAGPHVLQALERGRKATREKYQAAEVLDTLSAEPRKVFDMLTTRKDGALERLRAVQREAPQLLPEIGRAYLEELLNKATSEGGFGHTDALFSEWQKLGPQTKQAIFSNPGVIQELDSFFLLAKRIGQNPNPSGTARVTTLFNVGSTVPTWALAQLLYTAKGVRMLKQGLMIPRTQAQQVTYAARLNAAATDLRMAPAQAQEDRKAPPVGVARR